MRVCHIVRLHLFDFFRIRNGNQNVFSRYTKCLSKNFFNIENVLENFQYQNRIERFVSKRKDRIHVYDGKPVAAVIVPHEQWPGILAGNGFSPATVAAFVEMYDGINSGVVAPETGRENVRGATTLAAAAKGLLNG